MRIAKTVVYLVGFTTLLASLAPAQMTNIERGRAQDMLKTIAGNVRKEYYDPNFHGVDFNAKVAEAKQKIDNAPSFNVALSIIAATLDTLNDSHTFFLPPSRPYGHSYGWQYQMVGDRSFVTRVRPKSDAEAKGVKPGDEVLAVNGFLPRRVDLWKMRYYFNALSPQPGLRVQLQTPAGERRQLDVVAKIIQHARVTDLASGRDLWSFIRDLEDEDIRTRTRYIEMGDDLMVARVPGFDSQEQMENLIGKARKHKALILDLRENPGGSVNALEYLVGSLFDKDIKIGERVGRKDRKAVIAKPRRSHFGGKLVVLIDSDSGSAAEVFARVVQLEKRGTVLGDVSSGSVMEAHQLQEQIGVDTVVFYGVSVTVADLIMSDGKSLERTGVTPDQIILPTGADLANGRDPVLAKAAELVGVKLSPEDAGKMFPYLWAKQ